MRTLTFQATCTDASTAEERRDEVLKALHEAGYKTGVVPLLEASRSKGSRMDVAIQVNGQEVMDAEQLKELVRGVLGEALINVHCY